MSNLSMKTAIVGGATAAAAASVTTALVLSHVWVSRRTRRPFEGTVFDKPSDIPRNVLKNLDAVLVLGGGVPMSVDEPPIYVQRRCDDAADVVRLYGGHDSCGTDNNNSNSNDFEPVETHQLPILTLSAGTAHLPQLMSGDGLPVWESTSSAAYLQRRHGMDTNLYVETTSYDTIGNAFHARTGHTDVNGWRRLLIVTNEFHMDRTKAIFDWIFGIDNAGGGGGYVLYYLSSDNVGLTSDGLEARKQHEARGAKNVLQKLAPQHKTLKDVWTFLNHKHDLYTAIKLADRARNSSSSTIIPGNEQSTSFKESYGGGK